jgi:hypothetical protein
VKGTGYPGGERSRAIPGRGTPLDLTSERVDPGATARSTDTIDAAEAFARSFVCPSAATPDAESRNHDNTAVLVESSGRSGASEMVVVKRGRAAVRVTARAGRFETVGTAVDRAARESTEVVPRRALDGSADRGGPGGSNAETIGSASGGSR